MCTMLVLLVVMGLLFMMSYFKFQTTLTTLIQNRLTVVGITISESIHSAVDLGLALREVRTADTLIDRAKLSDPGIESIEIYDPSGRILYSTQEGKANGTVPDDFLQVQKDADGRTWGLDMGNVFVSGVSLVNSFGQPIGGVVLTYSKEGFDAQVATLTFSLARDTLLILAGFALLAFIGIKLGFRDLTRDMDNIRASLQRHRSDEPKLLAVRAPHAAAKPTILQVADFDERLSIIQNNVSEARNELDELEHIAPSADRQK